MSVADLVLRYLEAVEWPVVVVLVALLFRRSIRAILGRLSELSGAGVSAKFQTEAERLAGRAASLSAAHDPLATTGYPRLDTNPWLTPPPPLSPSPPSAYGDGDGAPALGYGQEPMPSPWEVSPPRTAYGDRDTASPYAQEPVPSSWGASPSPTAHGDRDTYPGERSTPPPPYTPQSPYGPPPPDLDEDGAPPIPYPQERSTPPPYGPPSPDGDGVPSSPYAPQPGTDGPAAPVPAQPAPAEEAEPVVPPPPSRSGDERLGSTPPLGQAGARAPATGDEPSDADEEPVPAADDAAATHPPDPWSSLERAHGESTDGSDAGPTGYGPPRESGVPAGSTGYGGTGGAYGQGAYGGGYGGTYGGGGYGDSPYDRGRYSGRPGVHGAWAGEGVPARQGPPPPPYAVGARGPVAAGGAYAPARARADADPASAIGMAWTQLQAVVAGLARGHSAAPRSGVYAQVGAMGAGADVTGLIHELDDMRRDAAAGTAPVTADAARAYVTAAEHVTAALTTATNH